MPLPAGALVALLLGAGFAGKEYQRRQEEEAAAERQQLGFDIVRQLTTPQTMPQVTGAQQPTPAPQAPQAPQPQVTPQTPGIMAPEQVTVEPSQPSIPMRPGEVTNVTIAPSSQLLSLEQAPYILKGWSYDPMSGKINMQYGENTEQLDAQWDQIHSDILGGLTNDNPNASILQLEDEAIARTISATKRLPSQRTLNRLDPARRTKILDSVFFSAVAQKYYDEDMKEKFRRDGVAEGLRFSRTSLDDAYFFSVIREVVNEMRGHAPEDVREILLKREQHLEYQRRMGREAAEQQIYFDETGTIAGPMEREATSKYSLGQVDLRLADMRPIQNTKLLEALQAPVGTTMGELKNQGFIIEPDWLRTQRADAWGAIATLKQMEMFARKVIKAGPEFWARVAQWSGATFKDYTGKDPNVRIYFAMREGLGTIFARMIAAERGPIPEKDTKRIEKLTTSAFGSIQEMEGKFEIARNILYNRIAAWEGSIKPRRLGEEVEEPEFKMIQPYEIKETKKKPTRRLTRDGKIIKK